MLVLAKKEIYDIVIRIHNNYQWTEHELDTLGNQAEDYVFLVDWVNGRGGGKPCDDIDVGYDLCISEIQIFIKEIDKQRKL